MDLHDHRHHRPRPISLPPRSASPRVYPNYTFPSTPTSTPSKLRRPTTIISAATGGGGYGGTFPSLLLLLASLQPLYTILPFLRSAPSPTALLPFSFLLSLLSFLLSIPLAALPFPFPGRRAFPALAAKSALLATSFFLRFLSLRSCGTGPTILAEFSGALAAHFLRSSRSLRPRPARGIAALALALFLLSAGWHRSACFPSFLFSDENCARASAMALPFISGMVGFYEQSMSNFGELRLLGRRKVRVLCLFITTVVLSVPAIISLYAAETASISFGNLGWPLLNTAVFGVVLSEYVNNDGNNKVVAGGRDLKREFGITFLCTVILELFYFPELSLFGFFLCGLLLWLAVRDLSSSHLQYPELGFAPSDSFSSLFWSMIRHVLSERKSRKIALFLLINTGYMVVEFVAGFMSNSLGLISDACHMLFDCAALAIGLYASYISRLPANGEFNYGRGRFEILSGYVNAVFLVLVGALIVLESFERILDPQEISTNSLLFVSVGGLLVNVVGLIFFHEEHHHAHGGAGSCGHSHHHADHHHHHHHHGHEHKLERDNVMSSASGSSVEDSGKIHHHSHDHDCHEAHSASPGHQHKEHDEHKESALSAVRIHSHEKSENGQCCGHHHDHDEHYHDEDPHVVAEHGHHVDHLHIGAKAEKEAPNHVHVDHNMEGIFLHVLADTLGSVGVVISTLLIKYKGWLVADPACSIFISVLIISSVIPLLRNSAEILLQRMPRLHEKDLRLALNDIMMIEGIQSLQNVHFWSLTNKDIVGTLHLHVSATTDLESCKKQVLHILNDSGINDLTIQLEHVKVT